jgi:hypothetical protein
MTFSNKSVNLALHDFHQEFSGNVDHAVFIDEFNLELKGESVSDILANSIGKTVLSRSQITELRGRLML